MSETTEKEEFSFNHKETYFLRSRALCSEDGAIWIKHWGLEFYVCEFQLGFIIFIILTEFS